MINNIDKIVKKISKVKVKSFSDELLRQLYGYLNEKSVCVELKQNGINIKCNDGYLNILFEKNEISYESLNNGNLITGKYIVHKNGYFVKESNKELDCYDIGDSYSNDAKYSETFRVFNKDGIEQFRRVTTTLDNYYENKKTGEITLHDPDLMENYKENLYIWRLDGKYVVERRIKEYIYPDGTYSFIDLKNSDDCLMRYEPIGEDTKELPNCGHFYGFDKDLFFKYFQKDSTITDIMNDVYSKHYRKILNTNEISI